MRRSWMNKAVIFLLVWWGAACCFSQTLASPIHTRSGDLNGQGYALAIGQVCYVVVPNHVISNRAKKVQAFTSDGAKIELHVYHRDPGSDLAILTALNRRTINNFVNLGGGGRKSPWVKGCSSPPMNAEGALQRSVTIQESSVSNAFVHRVSTIAGGNEKIGVAAFNLSENLGQFQIRSRDPDLQFLQGDSGSPVYSASGGTRPNGFLGILVSVRNGVGNVTSVKGIHDWLVRALVDIDVSSWTVKPSSIRIVSIERGYENMQYSVNQNTLNPNAMVIVVDLGDRHKFVKEIRLRTSFGWIQNQGLKVSALRTVNDWRTESNWTSLGCAVDYYSSGICRPYEELAATALKIQIVGKISNIKGIEIVY